MNSLGVSPKVDSPMQSTEAATTSGYKLTASEARVSEVIGRLVEFWGFKRTMGRIWAVLYLACEPLTAEQLRSALALSSGAVSMTLSELSRWGVVKKVWVQGERKDYYAAEVQLWKMISRVFNERERSEIAHAIEAFELALRELDTEARLSKGASDPASQARVARNAMQRERVAQLLELAKLGRRLLDGLVATAKIDAEPLVKFLLRSR
jgi:HTH-type transcriptional regulator, glycine betaine synthesis regulator